MTLRSEHWNDADGNPAGGCTQAPGLLVSWQNGPLQVDGKRRPQTGAFVEDLMKAVIDRIEFYQNSDFACEENDLTLNHLHAALESQQARTRDRTDRGVEGTHQK